MIRYAEPDDAGAMARVHVRAWQAGYRGLLPDAYLEGLDESARAAAWAEELAAPDGPTVLVLEVDGDVAGIASVGPARDDQTPGTGELWMLNLAPEAWGRGLGRRLLDASVDELRWARFGDAIAWVLDTNERARRFYERAGWVADGGEKADLDRGFVLRQVRYRRPVPPTAAGLRLERADPDDIDALLRLSDDLARWMVQTGIDQWRPGELTAGRVRHFVVDGETTLLRRHDEIVGSVAVMWEDPFGWGDRVGVAGYVHQLMVARSLAGQGLGRRLLQRAERRIAEAGHQRARLDFVTTNHALRRYYERAGYQHVGETDFGGRSDLRPCVLYEKRLTAPPAPTA